MTRYTDEELLNQIRKVAEELNRAPKRSEFDDHPETASGPTIDRRFNSYREAVRAAGYTLVSRNSSYTEEELLDQIRKVAEELNRAPKRSELDDHSETVSGGTIARRFDSYREAVRAAGHTPVSRNPGMSKRYTDEALLDQIRTLVKKNGGTLPTQREFQNHPETASVDTIVQRFGSYNAGVLEAGYRPHSTGSPREYSSEDLLEHIRELAEENENTPPTSEEFDNDPETPSCWTVMNRFGTWNKAVVQAGYTPRSAGILSRQELLSALQRAASNQEVERIRARNSDDSDFPSRTTYEKRFGGLSVAAIRGSIDIDHSDRRKAVPLTSSELSQFIELIPQLDSAEQAIALVSLLTGCEQSEHECVSKIGVDETETDPLIVFPSNSKRGTRTVSIGPLYSQLVREFDPIEPARVKQSINFSSYPYGSLGATVALRRISRPIEFDINRQAIGEQSRRGPQLLHRDLRCTHYLFEYTQGASQAWLADRLALTDNEIRHYHHFLDNPANPEEGWSVAINWRD